jgi:CO/xanthine dehydrogenase FAD-binding subunit
MVLGAKIELRSSKASRSIDANDWITNNSKTVLRSDELIVAIEIPRNLTNIKSGYAKLSHPASGAAIAAVVSLASARSGQIDFVRVAATGVSNFPFRATRLEAALIDNRLKETDVSTLAHLISDEVVILEDNYANGAYRRHIAGIQTARSLSECFMELEG